MLQSSLEVGTNHLLGISTGTVLAILQKFTYLFAALEIVSAFLVSV